MQGWLKLGDQFSPNSNLMGSRIFVSDPYRVSCSNSGRMSGHCGNAVDKLGLEEDVGIVEHTVFQGHDNKLYKKTKRKKI